MQNIDWRFRAFCGLGQIGDANAAMTLSVYAYLLLGADEHAAQRAEDLHWVANG
jgi:hypothetical protein